MDQSKVLELAARVQQVKGHPINEAMTKNSLVLPFLQALGYDIFDLNEVVAEFTADVGTKKGEKIDYTIMRDGKPVIMIECKALGANMDAGKCNQLHRYFMTHPSARIGILTDGARYMFFTDLEQPNIMDSKPFMEIDLGDFNERYLQVIQKFTKDKWDLDGALSSASRLKYVREVQKLFAEEVQNPSEAFVKYFASRAYGGHITAKVREQFVGIVQKAIRDYIDDQINARLESAKVAKAETDASDVPVIGESEPDTGVITTELEITGFIIVQTLLREVISPKRIVMRDSKSYCSVLFDSNNRKPICRLHLNGKKKFIGLFDAEKNEERVHITDLDDIYLHAEKLKATALRYVELPLDGQE